MSTSTAPPTYQFTIDVPVENRWDNVERVRSAVQYCFEAVFRDIAGRDAIAMVTGELVENAIKYGDWSAGRGIFRLRVWGDHERAAVAVTNAVSAASGGMAKVKEVIDFIAGQPTPLHAYQARLVALAGGGGAGGLGLVRVAYEGGCKLSMAIEGDEMTVTAERQHPVAGRTVGAPATA